MKKMNFIRLLLLSLITINAFSQELLVSSKLISNHAVLQREEPISITGLSTAGTEVKLSLGHIYIQTIADSSGDWQLTLPPQSAGGPYQMTISNLKEHLTFDDMYFGDVWVASGQSNMEWKFKWGVNNWQQEVSEVNHPLIRYFEVKNDYSATPRNRLEQGQWQRVSSEAAANFSAVAWYFAKKINLEENIPIGIVDASWGGSPAEAWTPANALLSLPEYKTNAKKILESPKKWEQMFSYNAQSFKNRINLLYNYDISHLKKYASLNYDDSLWKVVDLPSTSIQQGLIWYRKELHLNTPHKDGILSINSYSGGTLVFMNGDQLKLSDKTTPGTYNIPKRYLSQGKNLLAIRSASNWTIKDVGKNRVNSNLVIGNTRINLDGVWRIDAQIEGELPVPVKYWHMESAIFNAMIHPLTTYPIKGVIWYQGESNTEKADGYLNLFIAMIESWRSYWNRPDLPFIYAQLASYGPYNPEPHESNWALLREAQNQALSLNNTGMAVLTDAGEEFNIHPLNKKIVGERMAKIASIMTYGEHSGHLGPKPIELKINADRVTIYFQPNGGKLIATSNLKGFELASTNNVYFNASAEVIGDTIVVKSNKVKHPVSVRYAWKGYTKANLYNDQGFPVSPFRLGERHADNIN
jgi:sialate O-acetylesterase